MNNVNVNFYKGNTFSQYELGGVYFDNDLHIIKVATSETETQNYSGVQSASYVDGILTIINESGESIAIDLSSTDAGSKTPTDMPIIYFGKTIPTSKDQGNLKGDVHLRSKDYNIDCYCTLKVQGNSSTAYNKKNFTITFYEDAECTTKKKIDFGWGPQSKYVMKANWIDITHSRNVVSAQLWGDCVRSREDYSTLPELLRTSPNQGAVDGFPIKFYGNNVYWGRYTMNIPKDAWMTNMTKTNNDHLILCGENYNEALFRAEARWDETDWTDELHSEVPTELLARFNELVSFVMNSSDDDFKLRLSEYVDLQSVLDYYIFGLLICNLDGFGKNHIWLSYDGQKFIASAYDMDSTFGLYWDGSQLLDANYSRSNFEDMVSGRPGNLLYIRVVQNFSDELNASYSRLVSGPMSYHNVLERFENFINICPANIVAEDYAGTTGGGQCTGIPSTSTNNIQQIRTWYNSRISYVRSVLGILDPGDDIELPTTYAEWINEKFDGDATTKSPINTNIQLFSSSMPTWTIFVHAKLLSGTTNQRAAVHCMDETGSPWPGFVIQTSYPDTPDTATAELRATSSSSSSVEGVYFARGAEQYWCIQRDGNTLRYSIDGKTYTDFPGTIYEHTSPLVIGGYCNGSGQVLGGNNGREINGQVTVKIWDQLVDNCARLFIEQFPEETVSYNHEMTMISYDTLSGMSIGQTVEVMMVNPNKDTGYLLGRNATSPVSLAGTSTLADTKTLIDNNVEDTYKFIITKVSSTAYTIKSKIGGYGPTGTSGAATWSTSLMQYTISNATSIATDTEITTNINAVNNPCMIRFTNPSGYFLNAGGSASGLKYSTGTGAWSIWNLWLIDGASPS